jgi:hypothetical protein
LTELFKLFCRKKLVVGVSFHASSALHGKSNLAAALKKLNMTEESFAAKMDAVQDLGQVRPLTA